jgi:NADH:ubiquinone oxidoreductase subunit F (NADH-binding)
MQAGELMETTAASTLTVAAWPGCTPRLLRDQPGLQTVRKDREDREDLAAYSERGGYRPLAAADELLDEVERSGLLGRGGAAFPMAVKLRAVRDNGKRSKTGTVVVADGEEGEPASIKDRWLLRNRPHLVLDGLRLAATTVAADRTHV